jgi:hypothetical protein
VQENQSFEHVRSELEERNPILEMDTTDGPGSFSDFPKFPLETLKSPADDLPEEVDKTHKEVRTTLHLHFTVKNL